MGKRRSFTVWVFFATVLAAIAGGTANRASAAVASCAANAHANAPFAAWGDTAPYVLAPGGDVSLSDGAQLTTDCVRVVRPQPVVRLFARSTSGSGVLHVELLVPGTPIVLDGGQVSAPADLGPTDAATSPSFSVKAGAVPLQVRLTAVGGSFDVGDVYIDPFVARTASLG